MNRLAWIILVLVASFSIVSTASCDEVIVVVGASGSREYGDQFASWRKRWESVAKVARFDFTTIGPGGDNQTDRETLQARLDHSVKAGEKPLWIVFIGHGTWDGRSAKFNLVGPDVSAREIADWLRPSKRPLVIVNCSSSSAPFVDRLSGPNRVVVTATKSGSEQNFARFGRYFAEAIGEPESDLDHDDSVSVREAFLKAAAETGAFYQQEGRIATEHPMLDDNGDKKGSRFELLRGTKTLKGEGAVDGDLATQFTLPVSENAPRLSAQQEKRRRALEAELKQLIRENTNLKSDTFRKQALPILVKLAELYREVEAATAEE